jgi:hypothetical protein
MLSFARASADGGCVECELCSECVPRRPLPEHYADAKAATVPIGALAQQYYTLSLGHAIGVIIGFAALGCSATAFIATLGPQTGMRTMIVSRYSVGYYGGAIFSILNILTQVRAFFARAGCELTAAAAWVLCHGRHSRWADASCR